MQPTKGLVRARARLALKLPIRVLCRETAEYEWIERGRLVDVNQFGAGFTLARPIEIGRLVQLSVPLPHQLRCYDHFEPQYTVWGLVRHISANRNPVAGFRLGVAFIGKHAPASYQEDPTRRYEPLPFKRGQSSLWRITRRPFAQQRRETRLTIPLEVLVEAFDQNGEPSLREHTVTEAISSLGACVLSNLDVAVGRILRISSLADGVSVFAAIRSREVARDGITRLGLEFVGDRWPLERESQFIYQQAS